MNLNDVIGNSIRMYQCFCLKVIACCSHRGRAWNPQTFNITNYCGVFLFPLIILCAFWSLILEQEAVSLSMHTVTFNVEPEAVDPKIDGVLYIVFGTESNHLFETSCLSIYSLIRLGHYSDAIIIATNFDQVQRGSFRTFCKRQIGDALSDLEYGQIEFMYFNDSDKSNQVKWIKNLKRNVLTMNVINNVHGRVIVMDADIFVTSTISKIIQSLSNAQVDTDHISFDMALFDDCAVVQHHIISRWIHDDAITSFKKHSGDWSAYFAVKDCNRWNAGFMIINTHSEQTMLCLSDWTTTYNALSTNEEQNALDVLVFDDKQMCSKLDIVTLDPTQMWYIDGSCFDLFRSMMSKKVLLVHMGRGFRSNDGKCAAYMLQLMLQQVRV